MRQLMMSSLVLAACLSLSSRADAGLLYGADGSGGNLSNLYTIDPATGNATTIGPIGFAVTGLAFDPLTGILYGGTSSNSAIRGLITIDIATGAGTLVGDYGIGSSAADIAFDAAGNLFGWIEPGADDLYSINKLTGAATLVGDSGLGTAAAGLAFDNAGTLYLASFGTLYTLNPATGAVLTTVPPSGPLGLGLTFDVNNTLYGIARPDSVTRSLVTIDTTTGAFTEIGPTIDRLDALAFAPDALAVVPEPTSLALLGFGSLATALRIRRRKSVKSVAG